MKLPSKENVVAGKATGTVSPVASQPRESVPTANQACINERPGFITGTSGDRMRDEKMAYARDIGAPQARGLAPQGGEKVMLATIYTKEEELSTTSEEQPPRMSGWLPESFQRVIDSGMEKIYGPRPRRPYRPPMLEMEVEEDDYDPYFERHEAVQVLCKPEEGRVMYPNEKRRRTRRSVYPAEEDFEVMFQDELVMGGGRRPMMYDDEGDPGYADEGDMYDEETEDVLYIGRHDVPGGPN
ncbi:hypothetical protein HPB52_013925 [Rhipicephalus sanguineus]|uniref:Uncharacterized protein n=2 Tax=Rhipicephalus sanguineus TaxID=34632 RepID=A0A9D4SYH1_RHISA|nr:hypothetical protein HPB52_013925 [Rhipicephalus sanguineus]